MRCLPLVLVLVGLLRLAGGNRLVISSDSTTHSALGVVLAGGTFQPMLSRPAGTTKLKLHVPIRGVGTGAGFASLPAGPRPRIVLSGRSPTIQFYDRTSIINPCLDSSVRFVEKLVLVCQLMLES